MEHSNLLIKSMQVTFTVENVKLNLPIDYDEQNFKEVQKIR